jgi:thioredoxin-like negative regulator of GroEL
MIEINDKNYNNIIIENEKDSFIFLFKSKTCPHCHTVEEYFNIIEKDKNKPDNINFYIINAEKSQKLLELFKIRSFPTTLFFKKDKNVDSFIIGAEPIENFIKNIKKLNKLNKKNSFWDFFK